jgi:hypothetical protein
MILPSAEPMGLQACCGRPASFLMLPYPISYNFLRLFNLRVNPVYGVLFCVKPCKTAISFSPDSTGTFLLSKEKTKWLTQKDFPH